MVIPFEQHAAPVRPPKSSQAQPAAPSAAPARHDEHLRINCQNCGVTIITSTAQIGQMIGCIDCDHETLVTGTPTTTSVSHPVNNSTAAAGQRKIPPAHGGPTSPIQPKQPSSQSQGPKSPAAKPTPTGQLPIAKTVSLANNAIGPAAKGQPKVPPVEQKPDSRNSSGPLKHPVRSAPQDDVTLDPMLAPALEHAPWIQKTNDDLIRAQCSTCKTVLYLELGQAGTTVECPDCSRPVKVPKKQPPPAQSNRPGAAGNTRPSTYSLLGESQSNTGEDLSDFKDLVSALCPTCGTMLYAKRSQVGQKIECPDCFRHMVVPEPAPEVKPTHERKVIGEYTVDAAPARIFPTFQTIYRRPFRYPSDQEKKKRESSEKVTDNQADETDTDYRDEDDE